VDKNSIYEQRILPAFDMLQKWLNDANIPYVFVVQLPNRQTGDEEIAYQSSLPPLDATQMVIAALDDLATKDIGTVIDAQTTAESAFDGKAIDFTDHDETSETGT
jgi:hypothetical protein